MVEPAACAVHAALCRRHHRRRARRRARRRNARAVRHRGAASLLPAGRPRRRRQAPSQRKLARDLGADQVVEPGEHKRAARRLSGSLALESGNGDIERLTGGVDVVVDCVGSAALPGAVPRGRAARGQDRPRRHARRRQGRPRAAVAARDRAARRLRLRE